jgi:3-oxo-5-alpha-steroid 4-dehydrogenase 1
MTENSVYHYLILSWFGLAGAIFIALFFVAAPYGRHLVRGYGRTIANRSGWIIMEAPAPIAMAVCFALGWSQVSGPGMAFFLLWQAHYLHRAFLYPLQRKDGKKSMPLLVVSLGFIFNSVNGYLNSRYLFNFSGGYPDSWLSDPRFILGIIFFIIGFVINRQSDGILSTLRRPGESGYKLTQRGLYRWVSCPNYLGEIILWSGWALATWSMAGLSFAVWTAANLIPRARAHHAWDRKNLPGYPSGRKALLPGVW